MTCRGKREEEEETPIDLISPAITSDPPDIKTRRAAANRSSGNDTQIEKGRNELHLGNVIAGDTGRSLPRAWKTHVTHLTTAAAERNFTETSSSDNPIDPLLLKPGIICYKKKHSFTTERGKVTIF